MRRRRITGPVSRCIWCSKTKPAGEMRVELAMLWAGLEGVSMCKTCVTSDYAERLITWQREKLRDSLKKEGE